ncbi:phospholipid-transporting P-type ATPase [Paratrimastix pyriformis]|uniref:Phospholipid-transporting ATPase n=1 Tax=Paratrimastix pyriformis TaxID=342808 RepID=A0ABQ8UPZ3_9EUKA|nr:phospholipid-transporting P-type ATPase [Paratrimastix pyriformis]
MTAPSAQKEVPPASQGIPSKQIGEDGKPKEEPKRNFLVGTSPQPEKFLHNRIKTTKYSLATFLFVNLFEQFRRLANFYFLLIAIFQCIPTVSPTSPATSIVPLALVLSVTAVKEAIEDLRRYQSDRQLNAKKCIRVVDGREETTQWRHVQVGDILKVKCDEYFPADMILLSTSFEQGNCYVETTNLDGETNLKTMNSCAGTYRFQNMRELSALRGAASVELPNKDLYHFSGSLALEATQFSEAHRFSLDTKNLVLRACSLRNTAFIYGLVTYTGHESKIMKNSRPAPMPPGPRTPPAAATPTHTKAPSKRSNLERLLNKLLLILFAALGALVLFCAIANGIWTSANWDDHWYLRLWEGSDLIWLTGVGSGFRSALTFVILFNILIPISLYVTMEVVKLVQASLINADLAIYDVGSNTAANARTSNLNEELGQIEYIFSDKTGTLTRNLMEFFKCSVGGVAYGQGISEIRASQMRREGNLGARPVRARAPNWPRHHIPTLPPLFGGPPPPPARCPGPDCLLLWVDGVGRGLQTGRGFEDDRVKADLFAGSPQAQMLRQFFQLLAICHTCIPEEASHPQNRLPCPGGRDVMVTYKAASPDEGALVKAAAQQGFYFHTKRASSIVVSLLGQDVEFEVRCVLEFDSDRKRNSVITYSQGRYTIWTKGADTMILPRLAPGSPILTATREHLEGFAAEGLRTLVVGYRDIPEPEFAAWFARYEAAMNLVGDSRKIEVDKLSNEIEQNLLLLGATAIEDKLQEGVPETISYLRKAGLKIWVLTGDKQETAINIGLACNLLTTSSQMVLIFGQEKAPIRRQLAELRKHFSTIDTTNMDLAMVIEGKALSFCLQEDLKLDLLEFAQKCRVVICCRVSPAQKGDVVALVKENTGALTLAIGDGANDVNMIQRAHVGPPPAPPSCQHPLSFHPTTAAADGGVAAPSISALP